MLPRLKVMWEDGHASPATLELDANGLQIAQKVVCSAFDDVAAGAVPLGTLRATQALIHPRTIRALLDGALLTCAPILVVECGCARYIRDGHHRAVAHALQGAWVLQARVIRVDPE